VRQAAALSTSVIAANTVDDVAALLHALRRTGLIGEDFCQPH
jgi:hypothetical protein